MKTRLFFLICALLGSVPTFAQTAYVRVFRHDIRWTSETRFPNYFADETIQQQINDQIRQAVAERLSVNDVIVPDRVEYRQIDGFGKQKTDMPPMLPGAEPEIGIFSFITRATSGFAMFWKMRVTIMDKNGIIIDREVSHELEHFNSAAYTEALRWVTAEDFTDIFDRLLREALGLLPFHEEKIILGSMEAYERKIMEAAPDLHQAVLKIRGAWKSGGNFSAFVEKGSDTLTVFSFKEGMTASYSSPGLSAVLANLFTEVTGVGFLYEQKVNYQINGNLTFSNHPRISFRMKWIDIETRSTKSDETISAARNPVVTELYDPHAQAGYFVYAYFEHVVETDQTRTRFSPFTGYQVQNTLGIDKIHCIEGVLYDTPVYAEYNEGEGIIYVFFGEDISAAMVVVNSNPENTAVSNMRLSKNKRVMTSSSQTVGKPSLDNDEKLEWYNLYLPEDTSGKSTIEIVQTLVCLFFSIGAQG